MANAAVAYAMTLYGELRGRLTPEARARLWQRMGDPISCLSVGAVGRQASSRGDPPAPGPRVPDSGGAGGAVCGA